MRLLLITVIAKYKNIKKLQISIAYTDPLRNEQFIGELFEPRASRIGFNLFKTDSARAGELRR